jgi:branched-chain amino acid transport system permease protein
MGAFMLGSIIIPKYRLFVLIVTLVIFLGLWLFFKKSNLGMIIRAATRDSLMVETLGINISRVWTFAFMLGVGMAAFAGALSAPMVSAVPYMGEEMLIDSFVVVVIGGFGSLAGAMLGGFLIGQIVSFVSLFAPAYSHASIFFVMAIVLIFRPRGLLGEEGRL